MAIIYKGILGGIHGKVGSISGYEKYSKSIIRVSQNGSKVNNFGSQESVKGWGDNLMFAYNDFLNAWKNNIYNFLENTSTFNKDSLLKSTNYVRHKSPGVYPCESLFRGGVAFNSDYTISLNPANNFLTQEFIDMDKTLGSLSQYGVLVAIFGLSSSNHVDGGVSSSSTYRKSVQNMQFMGGLATYYVQSIITEYGTSNLALCPPYVVRNYDV